MSIKTFSFYTDAEKIDAIDNIAKLQNQDRSYVINQAIDQYISVQQYHISQIKEGQRQAKAGKLTTNAEVVKRFSRKVKK
jgi:predicted transcriptional regulator